MTQCLSNLLPSSVLAYNNKDLIANGCIPVIGTTAREIRPVGGRAGPGIGLPVKQAVKILPADRLYVEFWFDGVGTKGNTTVGDSGGGGLPPFAGGAGGTLIDDLLNRAVGTIDTVESAWTFHIANSESKINREVILKQEDFFTAEDGEQYIRISMPDYVVAVLGVTVAPINFLSPSVPLTNAQIAQARSLPAAEIKQKLGRDVNPDLLTDSDIRVLLDIAEIDELASLGNSNNKFLGWNTSQDGLIRAKFFTYDASDEEVNMYVSWDRDPRKNRFRADNEFDKNDGHALWNGSIDDITDKTIIARIKGKAPSTVVKDKDQPPKPSDKGAEKTLKKGDKIYVSYVGGQSLLRHAVKSFINCFIFSISTVAMTAPLNNIRAWTYKKYSFILPKNTNKLKFDVPEFIAAKKGNQPYVTVEGQRLAETKRNFAGRQYVLGCYYMDINGFSIFNFRTLQKQVVWPLEKVGNVDLFVRELDKIISKASYAYKPDKSLDLDVAQKSIFGDFVFDIGEVANSLCTDNQKYAYESFLVEAIKAFPPIGFIGDTVDKSTFIAPKLDLVNENASDLRLPDIVNFPSVDDVSKSITRSLCLQDVLFEKTNMQSSHQIFACNILLRSDVNLSSVRVQGDFLLRTPIFLDQKISTNGRIYVEKYQAKMPLTRDGLIFVGTNPSNPWRFSVSTDAYKNVACLAYMDSKSKTLRYRLFDDFETRYNLDVFRQYAGGNLPDFGNYKVRVDDFIGIYSASAVTKNIEPAKGNWNVSSDGTRGLSDQILITPGFNNQFGEKPGYYNGKEPDVFLAVAKARGYITHKETPIKVFEKSTDFSRLIDTSLGSQTPPGATAEDKYSYFTVSPYLTKNNKKYVGLWESLDGMTTEPVRLRRLRIVAAVSANPFLETNSISPRKIILESGDSKQEKIYELKDVDMDAFFNSTISLVFPFDNIVIDQIPIRGSLIANQGNINRNLFDFYNKDYPYGDLSFEGPIGFIVDIQVDVSYARLLPFQIRGPAVLGLDVQNMKIWVEDFITQDEYDKITIESTSISTCFDAAQYLYIFYEDKRANEGILKRRVSETIEIQHNGLYTDIKDDLKVEIEKYAFFESTESFTEISCLVSPDVGETWYDFKAIIRTMGREQIGNPMAIADHNSNVIHLFYNLNGNMMHKLIEPYEFDARDTFKAYIRPTSYQTDKTPLDHGLYHFSDRGRQMRSRYSTVVIENGKSKFITDQIAITNELLTAGRSDYRIIRSSISSNSSMSAITGVVDDGRELIDCFIYKDKESYLNLVYAVNGKLYIRRSGDNGISWFDILPNGLYIHKNAQDQEYRDIINVGFAYDEVGNNLYISYFVDNMIFYRRMEGTLKTSFAASKSVWSISQDLSAFVNKPYFVTGKMPVDVLTKVSAEEQFFVFPYSKGEEAKFAVNSRLQGGSYASTDLSKHIYGAQDLAAKGYSLSNGIARFFYIDEWDNLQAFSIFDMPVLDVQASQYFAKNLYEKNRFIADAYRLYKIKT